MKKVRELLADYDKKEVDVYLAYLGQLEKEVDKDGKIKNYWFKNVDSVGFANAFKKVNSQGLSLDGDSITLGWLKKLVITYDYHAFKNKVLVTYPETIFDFGVVYKGDEFTFKKESGKVIYKHNMNDPFATKRQIIGAYGVIKNSRGEFIETLNMDEIEKMKNSSKMKFIWDTWLDRMVLKSVIKRICSAHFNEITTSLAIEDNEVSEPENALISSDIQELIQEAKTQEELNKVYNSNMGMVEDLAQFIKICGDRKKEIEIELKKA